MRVYQFRHLGISLYAYGCAKSFLTTSLREQQRKKIIGILY